MGDLAIGALVAREESQGSLATAEEPPEPRPVRCATGQAVPGDQSAAQIRVTDQALVEVDLGVLHRAVEQGIGTPHHELRPLDAVRVCHAPAPLAFSGTRRDQAPVECQRRVPRHLPAREHDRDVRRPQIDPAPGRFTQAWGGVSLSLAADAQHQLGTLRGQHMGRNVGGLADRGRAEERVDPAFAFGEEKRLRISFPDQVLASQAGRPRIVNVG